MFKPRVRAAHKITAYNQLNEIYSAPEVDSELYHIILAHDNIYTRAAMPEAYHQNPDLLNQLILLGINFGEFGWALLDVKILDSEDATLQHAPILLKYAIKHSDLQPVVDDVVGALFKDSVLEKLHTRINDLLYEEDCVFIDDAFQYFYQHQYHTCALILASVIDGQSIRFIIDNYAHEPNMIQNPSQGWQSFAKIITYNYGDFLTLTFNDTKTKDEPRLRFQEKLSQCDPDSELAAHIAMVANISMSMMRFFSNTSWTDKELPASINRNWLAHGMYHQADVTSNDCIKLFVLLYQLLHLLRTIMFIDIKNSLPNNVAGGECLSMDIPAPESNTEFVGVDL